jgi:acetyl-CoA C-acetyltransferase
MSNSPHYLNLRKATKFGNSSSIDGMMNDGLTDGYSKSSMGVLADNCASDYSISRESQDD